MYILYINYILYILSTYLMYFLLLKSQLYLKFKLLKLPVCEGGLAINLI